MKDHWRSRKRTGPQETSDGEPSGDKLPYAAKGRFRKAGEDLVSRLLGRGGEPVEASSGDVVSSDAEALSQTTSVEVPQQTMTLGELLPPNDDTCVIIVKELPAGKRRYIVMQHPDAETKPPILDQGCVSYSNRGPLYHSADAYVPVDKTSEYMIAMESNLSKAGLIIQHKAGVEADPELAEVHFLPNDSYRIIRFKYDQSEADEQVVGGELDEDDLEIIGRVGARHEELQAQKSGETDTTQTE